MCDVSVMRMKAMAMTMAMAVAIVVAMAVAMAVAMTVTTMMTMLEKRIPILPTTEAIISVQRNECVEIVNAL